MLKVVTDPFVLKQYPQFGRVMKCDVCGTILRTGQTHTALQPVPHQAFDMLTVIEPLDFEAQAERRGTRSACRT